MNDLKSFSVKLNQSNINNEEIMEAFDKMMDIVQDSRMDYIQNLCKELNISEKCASHVYYLRTRSRWTPELEDELIELYRQGTPPNMYDF